MKDDPTRDLPEIIESENALDELMTRPRTELVEFVRTLSNPLLVLGAGGKMGPSLAVLAHRAAEAAQHKLEVIAVSRFSDKRSREWLEARGVRTVSCDLIEREALKQLPDSDNIINMVGFKFGTSGNPALTWAMNTLVPAHIAERFSTSRIAVLSSGNVYPLLEPRSGGAVETDSLTPVGEYANACVARERIFEFFSQKNGTAIVCLRLNYAVDLRYGVLLDIAEKVHAGRPVELSTGYFNCIWQGDANEFIIRSLELASAPSTALNLTGPAVLSVREVALQFGKSFGRPVQFVGAEAETALLNNPKRLCSILGNPPTSLETVIHWTAHWVTTGGRLLNKPTHFEVRDGRY